MIQNFIFSCPSNIVDAIRAETLAQSQVRRFRVSSIWKSRH